MQNMYTCVDCGTEEFFVGMTWSAIRDETGWRAYKQNDVWCHSCPDCVRAWAEKQTEMEDSASKPAQKAYQVVLGALTDRGFSDSEANMLIKKAQRA